MLHFKEMIQVELECVDSLLEELENVNGKPKGSLIARKIGDITRYSLRIFRIGEDGKRQSKQVLLGDETDERVRRMKSDYFYYEMKKRLIGNKRLLEGLDQSYMPYDECSINASLPEMIREVPVVGSMSRAKDEQSDSWERKPYERLERKYVNELYSIRGRRLRSKSEVIIANALELSGIPFRTEECLRLNVGNNIRTERYPDFSILTPGGEMVYWEHFGRLGDEEYSEKIGEKIRLYALNGIRPGRNLIITTDMIDGGIDSREVMEEIRMIKSRYWGKRNL